MVSLSLSVYACGCQSWWLARALAWLASSLVWIAPTAALKFTPPPPICAAGEGIWGVARRCETPGGLCGRGRRAASC